MSTFLNYEGESWFELDLGRLTQLVLHWMRFRDFVSAAAIDDALKRLAGKLFLELDMFIVVFLGLVLLLDLCACNYCALAV